MADAAPDPRRWSDTVTVAVVTDSAATVPGEMAERLNIIVVPLRLEIGSDSYRDTELNPEAVLDRTEDISTSGPSPADFVSAIESHAGSDGAVVATVSRALAQGTFLAARAAAGLVEVPTRVVDTATAAGGEGLVVLEAARVAAAGGTIDEVEQAALRVAGRVRLAAPHGAVPERHRGPPCRGRPRRIIRPMSAARSEAAAWAARWVGLRPVIELDAGKVSPLRPALSESGAHRRVLDTLRRSTPDPPTALHVAALHSLVPAAAEHVLADLRRDIEPATAFVGSFGSVMLVHAGPGVAGLAWWWADDPA